MARSAPDVVKAYFRVKQRLPTGNRFYDLTRIMTWLQREWEAERNVSLTPATDPENMAEQVVTKHASYYGVTRAKAEDVMLQAVLEMEHKILELRTRNQKSLQLAN